MSTNHTTSHGDNQLLKPTGIQIATESLPRPTTQKYRTLTIHVKMMSPMSLGCKLQCVYHLEYTIPGIYRERDNKYIYVIVVVIQFFLDVRLLIHLTV